jgi:hypothetical protein
MTVGERPIRVAIIELAQAVPALLIGLACYVLLLWVASRLLGIDVRAEISFTERPVEAVAGLAVIFALLVPVVFLACGLSLIAVRPLLQVADYENLVCKALKSPGFGPLKRLLLGKSKHDADAA